MHEYRFTIHSYGYEVVLHNNVSISYFLQLKNQYIAVWPLLVYYAFGIKFLIIYVYSIDFELTFQCKNDSVSKP